MIPEFAVTLLSFLRGTTEMAEFGIASIIGAAMFSLCMAPAMAALVAKPPKSS
jgi:Ca2+/Na+ antiporter